MNHADAEKIAKLGANIIISEEAKISFSETMKIIEIAIENGGAVTIEKKYHCTDIEKMAKIAVNKLTVRI